MTATPLASVPSFSTAGLPSASDESRSRHSLLAQTQMQTATEAVASGRPLSGGSALYPSFPGAPPPPPPPPPPHEGLGAAFASSVSVSGQPSAPPPPPPPPLSLMDAPLPSPHPGIALGPQEVGVVSLPPPPLGSAPPPPGAPCCAPAPPPASTSLTSYPAPPPLPPPPATASAPGAPPRARKGLRDVHIPAALLDDFLRAASAATSRNVEFCGILAGRLVGAGGDDGPSSSSHASRTFSICTLIIPKQEGTSDTVAALAEEEIFAAQDARGLFPLGWVHTHPSQSCFLSSVDVHTQSGYQTMLDEAVAVVCAPRDVGRRCGIFRLSTPGGLRLVQRCERRGFHPHPSTATGQPLYELCGHVYLNPRVGHEVLDLRQ